MFSLDITIPDSFRTTAQRMTRERRQWMKKEGKDINAYAKSISPVDANTFKRSWRYRTTVNGYTQTNEAARRGRVYSGFVHPAGDEETIEAKVIAEINSRVPRYKQDLQNIITRAVG